MHVEEHKRQLLSWAIKELFIDSIDTSIAGFFYGPYVYFHWTPIVNRYLSKIEYKTFLDSRLR